MCAIVTGAVLSVVLIVLSPTVWVDLLKHPAAIFPLRNPAIVSMTAAFLAGIVGSLATREVRAEAMFDDEKLRVYLASERIACDAPSVFNCQWPVPRHPDESAKLRPLGTGNSQLRNRRALPVKCPAMSTALSYPPPIAFGLGGTLLPGVLWAEMQPSDEQISAEMLRHAIAMAGLAFSDEDQKAMLEAVNSNLTRFSELRAISIPNDVSPPFHFSALVPGMTVNRRCSRSRRRTGRRGVWRRRGWWGGEGQRRQGAGQRHSAMANLATYPAVAVPNGFNPSGAPTSITFSPVRSWSRSYWRS